MPDSRLEIRWLKRALANLDAEAAFIARDQSRRRCPRGGSHCHYGGIARSASRPGPPRARRGHPRVGGPRYSIPGPLPRARPRCRNPPRLPWRPQMAEEALTAFGSPNAPSFFAGGLAADGTPIVGCRCDPDAVIPPHPCPSPPKGRGDEVLREWPRSSATFFRRDGGSIPRGAGEMNFSVGFADNHPLRPSTDGLSPA